MAKSRGGQSLPNLLRRNGLTGKELLKAQKAIEAMPEADQKAVIGVLGQEPGGGGGRGAKDDVLDKATHEAWQQEEDRAPGKMSSAGAFARIRHRKAEQYVPAGFVETAAGNLIRKNQLRPFGSSIDWPGRRAAHLEKIAHAQETLRCMLTGSPRLTQSDLEKLAPLQDKLKWAWQRVLLRELSRVHHILLERINKTNAGSPLRDEIRAPRERFEIVSLDGRNSRVRLTSKQLQHPDSEVVVANAQISFFKYAPPGAEVAARFPLRAASRSAFAKFIASVPNDHVLSTEVGRVRHVFKGKRSTAAMELEWSPMRPDDEFAQDESYTEIVLAGIVALRYVPKRELADAVKVALTRDQALEFRDLTEPRILRRLQFWLPRGYRLPEQILVPGVVTWLLSKHSEGRGGGRTGSLSGIALMELAAKPHDLAKAIRVQASTSKAAGQQKSLRELAQRVRKTGNSRPAKKTPARRSRPISHAKSRT